MACCESGWRDGQGGVYPCPSCRPIQHDRWETEYAPKIRLTRDDTLTADSLLDANPRDGIDHAREALEGDQ